MKFIVLVDDKDVDEEEFTPEEVIEAFYSCMLDSGFVIKDVKPLLTAAQPRRKKMPLTDLIANLVKVIEELMPGVGHVEESKCPKCGSVHLNWTSVNIDHLEDHPVAVQGESCMDCYARWEVVYVFSHLNIEGEELT